VTQPFGYDPPLARTDARPAVIKWFRVYAATSIAMYLGVVVALGVWQLHASADPRQHGETSPEAFATTIVLIAVALMLVVFFGVAAAVPYRPWGWTVGLVAICLGLSGCTIVAAVPLLAFWFKPTTKAAFGRPP
jgi:hypothetical protein